MSEWARARIQLCGRFVIDIDGSRIEDRLPGRKGRILFAYLVLNRGRPALRDELLMAGWGQDAPAEAANALSVLLSKLRHGLGAEHLRGRAGIELLLPQATFVDGLAAYPPGGQSGDTAELQKSPAFISTINADPSVSEVIHVGDIHSGKDFCTEAYDNQIASLWQQFRKPVVYTPGDNEWSDCHKATSVAKPGEGGGFYSSGVLNYIGTSGLTTDPSMCVDYHCGNPIDNLAKIRQLFFSQPGHTLGSGTLNVVSQATAYDPDHPADAQYAENVMWSQRDIVFVTINVPGGSNNDADVWYGAPSASQAQADKQANRTAADIRWLGAAFARATAQHAQGVAIVTQADMWDLDGQTPAHLTNYEPIIAQIASLTTAFARPVLLFNGDSHLYRSDNPLSPTAPCIGETDPATGMSVCAHDPNNTAWSEHPFYNVPNFHRVVVLGSTFPLEWLKLTIDPDAHYKTTATTFGPFAWQRTPQPQL